MSIEKGRYSLVVSAPYHEKQTFDVVIEPQKTTTLPVSLVPLKRVHHKILGDFILLDPGSFIMGSPVGESTLRQSNEVQHTVTLSRPVYMQEKEMTVGQWRWFIKKSRYRTEAEAGEGASILRDYAWEKDRNHFWDNPGFNQNDRHPVVCVSYHDVQAMIEWLNKNRTDSSFFRLPGEAEWEYACRAGSTDRFSFGPCLTRGQANFDGNTKWENCPVGPSSTGTFETGVFPANAWGFYDMHGNAMEWCGDWFGDYPTENVTDPEGALAGVARVIRGGGWASYAYNVRSAKRFSRSPDSSYSDLGFRLVLDVN